MFIFNQQYVRWMKIPLEWTGQSLEQWATNMLRNDKAPLDLLFLMILRDLTDVSAINS